MSRLLALLLFTLLCTCVRGQETTETTVPSKLVAATVYLDGAQVSRTARATVPAGRATLVFSGLTKTLDPQSIQVRSERDDFTVLSVSHRINYNEPPAENPVAEPLYARLEALEDREALLKVNYKITQEEEAILKQNRVVAGPQTGLNAEDLIAAVNFHRRRIAFIKRRQYGISDSLSTIKERRQEVQRQLTVLGLDQRREATAEVVVVTQSDRAVNDAFTLSYLVPDARWVPHYDVRVADISRPVDLRYRAKVSQQTGEDWTDVRLKLSTGDPTANAVAPQLSVWRLTSGSRPPVFVPGQRRQVSTGARTISGSVFDDNGEALIGASILVPGTALGTVTDLDGRYTLDVPAGTTQLVVSYTGYDSKTIPAAGGRVALSESAAQLDEVVVTGFAKSSRKPARIRGASSLTRRQETAAAPPPVRVERRATTVAFDIELPYSIPSDGKAREVEIRRYDLPATYTHLAVPKFSPDAYLTAAVTDWEDYDLLSGAVNLFFEGTYLGSSAIDVNLVSDTLEFSLGRDPNVRVERKATEDYRERSFFGARVTDSRGYTISVRN